MLQRMEKGDLPITQIPTRLMRPEFRFVPIEKCKKYPYEKNWSDENNYPYNHPKIKDHLEKGGNYGVVCGYGDLVVIDQDMEELKKAVDRDLPETFTVKTGGGGTHSYYICSDLEGPIRLKDAKVGDLGDVQYTGKQVVGPGSIHPNGNEYQIVKNIDIATVTAKQIRFALREFLKETPPKVKPKKETTDLGVSVTDVVPLDNLKRVGKYLRGPHPIHGSTSFEKNPKGPGNFMVNEEENLWCCYRHESGGGPLMWIAVEEGILDCADAVSGALRGEKAAKTFEIARERGLIDEDSTSKEPEVAQTLDLTGVGKVKVAFSDLYQRANVTRGSVHIWIGDDHHFEEDRKLSNQNLKRFVRDAIELTGIKDDHEAYLFKSLANLKDQARKEAVKETSGLESGPEKEKLDVPDEKITDYLEDQPLYKLCTQTSEVHKGDDHLKILARISGYSRSLLDFPLNLWSLGTSGSGKSHLFETVRKTIPTEYFLKFSSCSPKSMYYFCREYGEDALDGKITFFNEVEASEDAKVLLRQLTDPTEEENRLLTVEEQQMLEINIKGLPVSWFTSVDPLKDGQLKNRFLLCNPEETGGHKKKVADHQQKNIRKGSLQPIKDVDFPILKAAFREVVEKTRDKRVVMPFKWEWHYQEDSRLQPFFGSMVMASAKIHHRVRPQTDDTIIATLEDFYIAKLLFTKVIRLTFAGVKDKDWEVYGFVPDDHVASETRSGVAQKVGISTGKARHALERLVDADLINSEKEDDGKWYYWKAEKRLASLAVSLSQASLDAESITKELEGFSVACEKIRYTQGARSPHNEKGYVEAITHLSPSYMQNISQAVKLEEKDLKKLFKDCPTCKIDFASLASGELMQEIGLLYQNNAADLSMSTNEFVERAYEMAKEKFPDIGRERIEEAVNYGKKHEGWTFPDDYEKLGGGEK